MQSLGIDLKPTDQTGNAVPPDVLAAFRDACESQLGKVFSYVCYRVSNAAAAEDLTSVSFARALERLRLFDPQRGALSHWILGIARHAVTDHLRAQRRWALLPIDHLKEPVSREATPEQAFADNEARNQLARALRRLPNRDRDVLGMRFATGLTNREIASVTGLTERHVAMLLRRALARLKTHLERQGVTHA